jgi:hypothetical protein
MAISRINDALRPGERIVVTCRTQQYEQAIRPVSGIEVTLRAAAALSLCPLESDEDARTVARYLLHDAGGPNAKRRWTAVISQLGPGSAVGMALTTPLMVDLAREIYNPRPGAGEDALRDPAELCDPSLADRHAVEQHLFDALIRSAYRRRVSGSRRTAMRAERWLA